MPNIQGSGHSYSTKRAGGQPPRNNRHFDFSPWSEKVKRWIIQGIDKDTIEFADKFGEQIADKRNGMSTSQIRNVFGEMRRIQMNGYKSQKTSFLLLKPKLAYAVKRNKNDGIEDFFKAFDLAYEVVNKDNDDEGAIHFGNMMNLLEAVLAYHKYHGGNE